MITGMVDAGGAPVIDLVVDELEGDTGSERARGGEPALRRSAAGINAEQLGPLWPAAATAWRGGRQPGRVDLLQAEARSRSPRQEPARPAGLPGWASLPA